MKKHLHAFWHSFKNSFRLFVKHDTLTLGAALAYYTGFSLIPIVIIVISMAGAVLGEQAVQGEIKSQLQEAIGVHGAEQLQEVIKAVYRPGGNAFTTLIATILLLIGGTSVFSQLHTSLNLIWNIKPGVKQPVLQFFITRIFSFAMIVCLAFLLLVSFMVNTGLAALSKYLNYQLAAGSVMITNVFDFLISYAFTTLLFALVYKYMSDAHPRWRVVWPGALFTALLFVIGKHLMGFYLATFNMDDSYGAAGSVVLLLTWVFYSSQIVFFGAEFTHALAAEHGILLDTKRVEEDTDPYLKPDNLQA